MHAQGKFITVGLKHIPTHYSKPVYRQVEGRKAAWKADSV